MPLHTSDSDDIRFKHSGVPAAVRIALGASLATGCLVGPKAWWADPGQLGDHATLTQSESLVFQFLAEVQGDRTPHHTRVDFTISLPTGEGATQQNGTLEAYIVQLDGDGEATLNRDEAIWQLDSIDAEDTGSQRVGTVSTVWTCADAEDHCSAVFEIGLQQHGIESAQIEWTVQATADGTIAACKSVPDAEVALSLRD